MSKPDKHVMDRQRDEQGRFVRTNDALVLAAMLVAVELMVIGACTIYGITLGREYVDPHEHLPMRDVIEVADAWRAILGGVLFASGAVLGVLGFRR